MRQGAGAFKLDVAGVIADEENDLTPTMRLLSDLWEELRALEGRIAAVFREIEATATTNDVARRLATIPGIGPLGATAIVVAVGQGQQFRKPAAGQSEDRAMAPAMVGLQGSPA